MTKPFRTEIQKPLTLAGLNRTYKIGPDPGMKIQWEEFMTDFGKIEGQVGFRAYGVCHNINDGEMDYLTAVEVKDGGQVPGYFHVLDLAEHEVAVFTHNGHVETISETWMKIFDTWLPKAKLTAADGPQYEVYHDGMAAIEIVIPVRAKD